MVRRDGSPHEQENCPAASATGSLIANLPPSEGGKATMVEGAQIPNSLHRRPLPIC